MWSHRKALTHAGLMYCMRAWSLQKVRIGATLQADAKLQNRAVRGILQPWRLALPQQAAAH